MSLTHGLPYVLQHAAAEVVQTFTSQPKRLESDSADIGVPCLFRVVKE